MRAHTLLVCCAVASAVGTADAQTKKKAPAAAPRGPPCSSSAHRQFDFWIGEWDVATPQGAPAGTNRVERLLDGCALQEHWVASDGSKGTSLSSYDAATRLWRQTYVDDTGQVLVLEGEFKDGKMVLQGEKTLQKKGALQRISWQPMGDKVRQRWDISQDDGRTWSLLFEGVYSRRAPP